MAKRNAKPAVPAMQAPQTREEAAAALARLGAIERAGARIEQNLNEEIAALKTVAEAEAAPLLDEGAAVFAGLQAWCAANRAALTDGGKVKSADLGSGTIGWRLAPAKVTLREIETVIARIKELKLGQFLRTKDEVNKEAMLQNPALANTIAGVSVKSAGEAFYAEPLHLPLAEAAP